MKKNILKTITSIMVAAAICTGLAVGALSAVSSSQEPTVVATPPGFLDGIY